MHEQQDSFSSFLEVKEYLNQNMDHFFQNPELLEEQISSLCNILYEEGEYLVIQAAQYDICGKIYPRKDSGRISVSFSQTCPRGNGFVQYIVKEKYSTEDGETFTEEMHYWNSDRTTPLEKEESFPLGFQEVRTLSHLFFQGLVNCSKKENLKEEKTLKKVLK